MQLWLPEVPLEILSVGGIYIFSFSLRRNVWSLACKCALLSAMNSSKIKRRIGASLRPQQKATSTALSSGTASSSSKANDDDASIFSYRTLQRPLPVPLHLIGRPSPAFSLQPTSQPFSSETACFALTFIRLYFGLLLFSPTNFASIYENNQKVPRLNHGIFYIFKMSNLNEVIRIADQLRKESDDICTSRLL